MKTDTSKTLPALTKEGRQAHVKKVHGKYAYNRATILEVLELSELDYESAFFEAGCQFLEQMCADNNFDLSSWFNALAKDPKSMFWKWFKCEFKTLEDDFMNTVVGGGYMLKMEMWEELLKSIPHEAIIEKSFQHYLKIKGYVKV